MSKFRDPRIDKLYRENSHPDGDCFFFLVPIHVAMNQADPFHTFLSQMIPIQAYAVSEDLEIFMCTKPKLIKFNRDMLTAMINDNVSVEVHRVRAYVELQDETGNIIHPDGGKSIKAIHVGGRLGALNWEQLQAAVNTYGLFAIILDSELQAFKEANGYNVEPEI